MVLISNGNDGKKNKKCVKSDKSIKQIKKNKNTKNCCGKKKARKYIPKKLREEVWVKSNGLTFNSKCNVVWCSNSITVFDYHIGHNIPHSKGGSIELSNLKPICARCNLSMSNNYTIEEWNKLIKSKDGSDSNNNIDNESDSSSDDESDNEYNYTNLQTNLLIKKIKNFIYLCVTFGLFDQ